MTIYNLSVVNIIPKNYKDIINLLAEAYGCGPDNISIPLVSKTTKEITHYGCHSFWRPTHYSIFSDNTLRNEFISTLDIDIQESIHQAVSALYERLVLEGDAQDNWNLALTELDLELFIYEEEL